jgi:hypothetical protein
MFVGIDRSKTRLDVALRPGDETFSVANNPRGIASLVKRLKQLPVNESYSKPAAAMRSRLRVTGRSCVAARSADGLMGWVPPIRPDFPT